MVSVVGIDPSLRSTGVAFYNGEGVIQLRRIVPEGMRGTRRLAYIADAISGILDKAGPVDLVAYEGYAMGYRSGMHKAFDLGELGGVLKLLAYSKGCDVLLVPPTSLKKFATGNGAAKKRDIRDAIISTWGITINQDDKADAYVLLQMGRTYLQRKRRLCPQKRAAMRGCTIIKGKA